MTLKCAVSGFSGEEGSRCSDGENICHEGPEEGRVSPPYCDLTQNPKLFLCSPSPFGLLSSCLSGQDCLQCQRHGSHASRAGDPGDGQTPVHRGSALRVPDWGEALPHPGVSEWYGIGAFFVLNLVRN